MAKKTTTITKLIVDGKTVAQKTGKKILRDWVRLSKLKGITVEQIEV